jgi:hypothetical protein
MNAAAPTLAGLTAKLKAEIDRKEKASKELAKWKKVLAESDARIDAAHRALAAFRVFPDGQQNYQQE